MRKSQNARKLFPWSDEEMVSRSPKMSSSRTDFPPSQAAIRSRTARSRSRKFWSTSLKSESSSRAVALICRNRSLMRVEFEHVKVAFADTFDLRLNVPLAALQFVDARPRIRFRFLLRVDEVVQIVISRDLVPTNFRCPRLASQFDGLFGCGRDVEMRFVAVRRIVLAKPAMIIRGPGVQVLRGRPRKRFAVEFERSE